MQAISSHDFLFLFLIFFSRILCPNSEKHEIQKQLSGTESTFPCPPSCGGLISSVDVEKWDSSEVETVG